MHEARATATKKGVVRVKDLKKIRGVIIDTGGQINDAADGKQCFD